MNTETNAPANAGSGATPSISGAFRKLMPELQQAVAKEGYSAATPIQEQCIEPLLEGRDLIGCAQTGTGKTAAFSLPMLQRLSDAQQRPVPNTPRALILAPTRELAVQIGDSIDTYGRFLKLRHTVIYGGVKQHRQVNALKRGVDIVVATPGRLLDLMQQGHVKLQQVEIFVLDEVDRMLDMGFIPDVKRILATVPDRRQTMCFSATLAKKIMAMAESMVRDPVKVTIEPEKPTVERIDQRVLFVDKRDKNDLLISILRDENVDRVIVFTQMKHSANKLVKKLGSVGIQGTALHGNKSQAARTRALDGFKGGKFRVLVATDVAARGLDVDDISHVVNYDLPQDADTYVHRIGRTGRAGAEGGALSFCTSDEGGTMQDIDRLLGNPVPEDVDHPYHCTHAQQARSAGRGRPKRGGGGGGRAQGNRRRNRRRGRR